MAISSALGGMLGSSTAKAGGQQAAQYAALGGIMAAQTAKDLYNRGVSYEQPYMNQGTTANASINDVLYGSTGNVPVSGQLGSSRITSSENPFDANAIGQTYTASPGYAWSLEQGQKAIDASAAARGNLLSGDTIKAGMTYAQGVANQDYWNYVDQQRTGMGQDYAQRSDAYNRIAGQQAVGANAANAAMSGAVSTGNTAAGAISSGFNTAANATSSAANTAANAWSGAAGNAGNTATKLASTFYNPNPVR